MPSTNSLVCEPDMRAGDLTALVLLLSLTVATTSLQAASLGEDLLAP